MKNRTASKTSAKTAAPPPQPIPPPAVTRVEDVAALPAESRALLAAARAAQKLAYAPYSRFPVGAAVRARDGRVFSGANVENASYGLAVCAERNAALAAALAGVRDLVEVAVCTRLTPPAAPCGMCRQTLTEFAADCRILLCTDDAEQAPYQTQLSLLLPASFRPDDLTSYMARQDPVAPTPPPRPASRRRPR